MRAWLYDLLTQHPPLQAAVEATPSEMLDRVMPRRSEETINLPKPWLMYGLGNATSEDLSDSTAKDPQDKNAERQFFQIWIHDEGGDFNKIDDIARIVIALVTGAESPEDGVLTVRYLETSAEFSNETYNTNFRYIRFQAIKV